jgi:DNA-directed RNA polymerase alpha subunit
MDQGRKRLKTKQSLREHDISDLFSDELSDVPSYIFSDCDTVSGDDKKKIILATESESECETESSTDESGDSNNAGATTWVKLDKTPTLGQFSGTPGVENVPSHPNNVSEITELFLDTSSFICYVRKQTDTISKIVTKYDRSCKEACLYF